jgi:hypothetical protein
MKSEAMSEAELIHAYGGLLPGARKDAPEPVSEREAAVGRVDEPPAPAPPEDAYQD